MNFNSPQFAVFLSIVLTLYMFLHFVARSRTAENLMLLLASCFFYGSWDHRFLFLFLFSTALDYVCGLAMDHRKPPPATARSLLFIMLTGAFFLCAPIDWPAIESSLLPKTAFSGGWAEPIPWNGFFLKNGDWTQCGLAFAGVAFEAFMFFIGYRLKPESQKRWFLDLSLISQIVLLGFFKYFDFFVGGLTLLLESMNLGNHHWELGIIVPVGISFYTFHTMSYTIDVYRGRIKPTDSLIDFALFVAYFPQMVAGPIARGAELLPQFAKPRRLHWETIQVGAYLIGWGLFKKIYIADNLLALVARPYTPGVATTGPEVLLATYAFCFQIYCDFSAYSDIARGVSRLMGVELMLNFNNPYAAANPREFWRRWHISLSSWLRDYLYQPLGGNRGGPLFIYRNLMITMVLGGIWHGARSNYLWWGVYQGLLLCLHRMLEPTLQAITPRTPWRRSLFQLLCWITFFHLVCYGWLLFRAESTDQILMLTRSLFSGWPDIATQSRGVAKLLFYCWPLWLVQFVQARNDNLLAPLNWPWPLRGLFYFLLFYLTVIFGAYHVVEFIYFQF